MKESTTARHEDLRQSLFRAISRPARSATRMHCATPAPPARCACGSNGAGQRHAAARRAWIGSRSPKRAEGAPIRWRRRCAIRCMHASLESRALPIRSLRCCPTIWLVALPSLHRPAFRVRPLQRWSSPAPSATAPMGVVVNRASRHHPRRGAAADGHRQRRNARHNPQVLRAVPEPVHPDAAYRPERRGTA